MTGLVLALRGYPGDFDWQYTVVSALASQKHNPAGGVWYSAGLGVAMLWLWPYLGRLRSGRANGVAILESVALKAMRAGIVFGVLMGLESILVPELPEVLEKLHELLALSCFLCFYIGVLCVSVNRMQSEKRFVFPVALIVIPIIAIGVSQLTLYLGQRDLGWVDQSWRELGVPLWQSFAFWQWLALFFLWGALGMLGFLNRK
ncbi:hypothetical protein VDG1235_4436 [Verrucomicrobiia bacterium DG1235]|nr:hypothetical protein VDG1235_4436 [Verrucomicrobiae bacterium DG1235]